MLTEWWLMPLLGGLLLAAVTGPLGSFVVWRRMAFFGDTLAHGALLGITLGVLLDLNLTLALIISSILLALLLLSLQNRVLLSSDTLLGIISHGTLATGLVVISLAEGIRIDLMAYLFGDLLALDEQSVLLIAITAALVISLLIIFWQGFLAITVSPELASIDGHPVKQLQLLLVILLAVVVVAAMKVVGIMLVSALLIIPAAAARGLARTPVQMVLLSSLAGMLSVLAGMFASYLWDTPAGPSIVVVACTLFITTTQFARTSKSWPSG